jgi:3',5'-cyclic AMP phosphodiesterase CpdA
VRLVISSDWHYGRRIRDQATFDQLIEAIERERPDGVLVLGDIANEFHPKNYGIVFPRLAALGCPVGVLCGNHDVWLGGHARGLTTSWQVMEKFADLAEVHGLTPLDRTPLQIGELQIAGTLGWYDYSLGSPLWSTAQYATKRFDRGIWNDGKYARWPETDPEVCHILLERLETTLARRPAGAETMVVSHVAALSESLAVIGRPLWDFFNAYMGTARLGELLDRHGIRAHFFGHTHSEHVPIPEVASTPRSDLRSYNACFYLHRPYLVAERDVADWIVRPGDEL